MKYIVTLDFLNEEKRQIETYRHSLLKDVVEKMGSTISVTSGGRMSQQLIPRPIS